MDREYLRLRAIFLGRPKNRICPVLVWLEKKLVRTREIHHMRGRLGPLLLDQRFWLATSKKGHKWIHANPDAAREQGWLCAVGDWNRIP
jgi:hypothetical protein